MDILKATKCYWKEKRTDQAWHSVQPLVLKHLWHLPTPRDSDSVCVGPRNLPMEAPQVILLQVFCGPYFEILVEAFSEY